MFAKLSDLSRSLLPALAAVLLSATFIGAAVGPSVAIDRPAATLAA